MPSSISKLIKNLLFSWFLLFSDDLYKNDVDCNRSYHYKRSETQLILSEEEEGRKKNNKTLSYQAQPQASSTKTRRVGNGVVSATLSAGFPTYHHAFQY
jgi:hypothetical protein